MAPRYIPRFLKMLALSLPMLPTGMLERALYHKTIERTALAAPPLFILGHWRTGSTHLHNILSQDSEFGYLSTFDAFGTNNSLFCRSVFKELARRITPTRRPMDEMLLDVDLPQEEEYALSNISTLSYYKLFSFPKLARRYADRHLFFDDVPAEELNEWKQTYDFLLRHITYVVGHRQLLLKNPPNTARLGHLLDMYPDARVIYLYRRPHEVFLSTLRMRQKMCELLQFQAVIQTELSDHILYVYPRMIERFFAALPRVRPGHFVALDYAELKARPLLALERIYATLGLPGFGTTRARFSTYLETLTDYRATSYQRDDATLQLVAERWSQAHALHDRFAAGQ